MTKRQKIAKYQKVRHRITWIAIFAVMAALLVLSIQQKKNTPLDALQISIQDLPGKRNLISKKEVKRKITNHLGFDVEKAVIADIDLASLEQMIDNIPVVETSEVFIDANNVVRVQLTQRQPLLRVASNNGEEYYLDKEGGRIPVKAGAAVRVAIVTGEIPPYEHGFLDKKKKNPLKDAFNFMTIVQEDPFMLALVEQVDIARDGYMTIAPKLGRKRIRFGHYENVEEKIKKLKVVYKELLPVTGWDKHDALNLEFKDQVIAQNLED